MSEQQFAITEQAEAADATATLATPRGLKLPAFPVAATPPVAATSPGSSDAAANFALDLPRPRPSTTEYLRRFPLIPSRASGDGRNVRAAATPPHAAPPREAPEPPSATTMRPKRVPLPATPAEPTVVMREVQVHAYPPLTGEGSLIDRKVVLQIPMPAPLPTVEPPAPTPTSRAQALLAALPDSPILLAAALLTIGVLLLLWTIITRPPQPYGAFLILNGIGLCLAAAMVYGVYAFRARRDMNR